MSKAQKFLIEHALYPAMERLKGNHIREKLAALQSTERAPDLHERQTKLLAALLLHCSKHVPAYQKLDLDPQEIARDPFSVLKNAIPPLPKQDFRVTSEHYLADNIPVAQRIDNCTGGSTGEPVHFYMTRNQVETYEAARWRGLSWFGITPGSRSMMVWANPFELSAQQQRKQRMREALLKNRRIIPAYDLKEENAAEYVAFINRYRPEYIYGYASSMAALAEMLERCDAKINVPLKAAVSTSETLTPEQAELFRRVFHCPVANEYGARDAGILAYSCPEGHLHISAENCIIEVLDPITHEPVPDGQSGILAITDLHNYVHPRLRYMLGDMGSLGIAPCPCGRTLPTLRSLDGREDALLVGHDSALLHGDVVAHILRELPSVRGYQFVQHSPERATLYLVPMPGAQIDPNEFMDGFRAKFPDAEIEVRTVDKIQPAASGKMRYTIREFPLPHK